MPQTSITMKFTTEEYEVLKAALTIAEEACLGNGPPRNTTSERVKTRRSANTIAQLRKSL